MTQNFKIELSYSVVIYHPHVCELPWWGIFQYSTNIANIAKYHCYQMIHLAAWVVFNILSDTLSGIKHSSAANGSIVDVISVVIPLNK